MTADSTTHRTSLATTSLAAAAARLWDAVVVGAGPAGTMAAREMARQGADVLLVEKASFPRAKVCGCCLSGAALAALESVGLGDLPANLGAPSLDRWHLFARRGEVSCPLPAGAALSREQLDAALVESAVKSGAAFLDETQVSLDKNVDGDRTASLTRGADVAEVRGSVVIAADGLGGQSLSRLPEFERDVEKASRLGAGTIVGDTAAFYEPGTIYMACGRAGYVGLVRLEDGRLDIAAAFDLPRVREAGDPAKLAAQILDEVGLPAPSEMATASWRGTPTLTRSRARVAAERVFVAGDAAGYIEPFTGEGIAWALATGIAVAPIALAGVENWSPDLVGNWQRTRRSLIRGRQRSCRRISKLLRSPVLANLAVRVLRRAPWLAKPTIRALNTPIISARGPA